MTTLTPQQLLEMVPQQRPMRFIDEILEVDEEHILGTYRWSAEDCAKYSPGDRIVPPFKLIEMAAQIGNVAWCIYHMARTTTAEEMRQLVGFFTEIEDCSFKEAVEPGDTVACMATFDEEGYFRTNKLVSKIEAQFAGGPKDGREIFSCVISGMWVPKTAEAFG